MRKMRTDNIAYTNKPLPPIVKAAIAQGAAKVIWEGVQTALVVPAQHPGTAGPNGGPPNQFVFGGARYWVKTQMCDFSIRDGITVRLDYQRIDD